MKHIVLNAFFPELPSSRAYQSARGEGHDTPLAIYRALRALWKSPAIKGRRISTIEFKIGVMPSGTLQSNGGDDGERQEQAS